MRVRGLAVLMTSAGPPTSNSSTTADATAVVPWPQPRDVESAAVHAERKDRQARQGAAAKEDTAKKDRRLCFSVLAITNSHF